MTIEQPTNIAGGPLLEPHSGGCRCWPHVSQSDAVKAVEHAALSEYRDGLRRLGRALDVVRLTQHYITAIECDHESKTDTIRCNCSVWTGTPQPSVGAAVRQWAEHVLDIAPTTVIERDSDAG